jgi:hypothetical protein
MTFCAPRLKTEGMRNALSFLKRRRKVWRTHGGPRKVFLLHNGRSSMIQEAKKCVAILTGKFHSAFCHRGSQHPAMQSSGHKTMLKDKPVPKRKSLTAYISESTDREGNTFYIAAICDDAKDELIEEISGYLRDALKEDVLGRYPEIEFENG